MYSQFRSGRSPGGAAYTLIYSVNLASVVSFERTLHRTDFHCFVQVRLSSVVVTGSAGLSGSCHRRRSRCCVFLMLVSSCLCGDLVVRLIDIISLLLWRRQIFFYAAATRHGSTSGLSCVFGEVDMKDNVFFCILFQPSGGDLNSIYGYLVWHQPWIIMQVIAHNRISVLFWKIMKLID